MQKSSTSYGSRNNFLHNTDAVFWFAHKFRPMYDSKESWKSKFKDKTLLKKT